MNIAVVDDEKVIREQIKKLIRGRVANCHIDTFATGEELLAAGKNYDIVFLDIQMGGISGIDTARSLRERHKDSVIIFITGIREYVFDAFDVSAFHYLLKPIGEIKFAEVFDRAVSQVEKQRRDKREQVFIKTKTRNITLDRDSIYYVESRGKKVEIHTSNEVIEIYASMNELEEQLGGNFYRCHRGYLVNMAHIAEYENDSISLGNGEKIFMAKERYSEFVKEYMRYLRNGGTACV